MAQVSARELVRFLKVQGFAGDRQSVLLLGNRMPEEGYIHE